MNAKTCALLLVLIVLLALYGCNNGETGNTEPLPSNYTVDSNDLINSAQSAKDMSFVIIENRYPNLDINKYSYETGFDQNNQTWHVAYFKTGYVGGDYIIDIKALDGSIQLYVGE